MIQFIFCAFISIMLLIAMLWIIKQCYIDFRREKRGEDLFFMISFIGMIMMGVCIWIDVFNKMS